MFAALCAYAPNSRAQETVFDQPQPESVEPSTSNSLDELEISDAPYVLPSSGYTIYFVHKDGLAPNEAALRVTMQLALTGCFHVGEMETATRMAGSRLEIAISEPIVKKDETPQYAHNTCKKSTSAAVTDVVLNRDDLIDAGINSFAIKSQAGIERYDALVDSQKIMLFTKYKDLVTNADKRINWHDNKSLFKPYKGSSTKTPLTYWFYPENTIILSIPQAKPADDFSAHIKKAAAARGLIPLETIINDFKNPSGNKNKLYFVDQTGAVASGLETERSEVLVDIAVPETFYGPEGAYERPKKLAIMAKLPGLME